MKMPAKLGAYFLLSALIFTSMIAMSTAPITTTDNSISSSKLDSDIAASQAQKDALSRLANGWNAWYLRFLAMSVVLGAATVVCQYKAIARSRDVSDVDNKLLHLKDIKAARELETIKKESARIEGDAKTEAKRIESEANLKIAAANERAGEANREAGKARSDAATALLDQEKIRRENIVLGHKLEAERSRRVKLQRSVLHRMIVQVGVGDKMNWDSLKPFKGVNVAFKYPDGEPSMFQGSVGGIIINAGWNFLGGQIVPPEGVADGVTILAYVGPKGETDRSMEAAKALGEFMANSGIEEVKFGSAPRGALKPDTVEVIFGQMPDPFRNE